MWHLTQLQNISFHSNNMLSPVFKRITIHSKIKNLYYMSVMSLLFVTLFVLNARLKYTMDESMGSVKRIVHVKFLQVPTEIALTVRKKAPNMKYILLWTDSKKVPFVYFEEGTSVFVKKQCQWKNCYVTGDREYFEKYSYFDVIAFNAPQLHSMPINQRLYTERSIHQKFVYASIEAAGNYPLCNKRWNRYFNWTWTYKLNSDAIWGYFIVKNATGSVIGPNIKVPWIQFENMDPIDEDFKIRLKSKHKAAAWFVSNCYTVNRRESFVQQVQTFLKDYNLKVDVYGDCGTLQCPRDIMNHCLEALRRDYYFYFAFENAMSEDYVTEKLMNAVNYDTVPVVFGKGNYSRFLPPGSYLDALEYGAKSLAQKINDLIKNPNEYYNYFRWRKYYSFHLRHESPATDDYCRFCAMVNDEELMNKTTIYENLDTWWTDKNTCNELKMQFLLSSDTALSTEFS